MKDLPINICPSYLPHISHKATVDCLVLLPTTVFHFLFSKIGPITAFTAINLSSRGKAPSGHVLECYRGIIPLASCFLCYFLLHKF